MALSRRTGIRFQASIWPGFVDAMTGLLLVLMFVLTIFMVVQFALRETIKGQGFELEKLTAEIIALGDALGVERQSVSNLKTEVGLLITQLTAAQEDGAQKAQEIAGLKNTISVKETELAKLATEIVALGDALISERQSVTNLQAELGILSGQLLTAKNDNAEKKRLIDTLTSQRDTKSKKLADANMRITDFEAQVTQFIAQRNSAQTQVATLEGEKADLDKQLFAARTEIDEQAEAARLAAAQRALIEQELAQSKIDANNAKANLTQTLALLAQEKERVANLFDTNSDMQQKLSALEAENAAAQVMRDELENVQDALSAKEKEKLAAQLLAQRLRERLQNSQAELTALTLALEEERKKAENTLTLLAAARAQTDTLENDVKQALLALELAQQAQEDADTALMAEKLTTEELSQKLAAALQKQGMDDAQMQEMLNEAEQKAILLNTARARLAAEKEISAAAQREVEALNQQVAAVRQQLGSLNEALDASEAREVELGAQIVNLGSRLNAAMTQLALESKRAAKLEKEEQERLAAEKQRLEEEAKSLAQYKSEFLGRVRTLLEGREGVRLVGDRFVFSSEVLFAPGDAALSDAGRAEISKISALLRDIAADIPQDIDWILQVDGHTDNVRLIEGADYANNWELSQARALSVVLYMAEFESLPPNRLSANGFGEYQPLNSDNTTEARAQNRRIELKFTEK